MYFRELVTKQECSREAMAASNTCTRVNHLMVVIGERGIQLVWRLGWGTVMRVEGHWDSSDTARRKAEAGTHKGWSLFAIVWDRHPRIRKVMEGPKRSDGHARRLETNPDILRDVRSSEVSSNFRIRGEGPVKEHMKFRWKKFVVSSVQPRVQRDYRGLRLKTFWCSIRQFDWMSWGGAIRRTGHKQQEACNLLHGAIIKCWIRMHIHLFMWIDIVTMHLGFGFRQGMLYDINWHPQLLWGCRGAFWHWQKAGRVWVWGGPDNIAFVTNVFVITGGRFCSINHMSSVPAIYLCLWCAVWGQIHWGEDVKSQRGKTITYL